MKALSMPSYRVDFVNQGENVYYTEEVEDKDDEAVMEHMRRSYRSLRIGAGFDIWDGKRLVHQHRSNGFRRPWAARPKQAVGPTSTGLGIGFSHLDNDGANRSS